MEAFAAQDRDLCQEILVGIHPPRVASGKCGAEVQDWDGRKTSSQQSEILQELGQRHLRFGFNVNLIIVGLQ